MGKKYVSPALCYAPETLSNFYKMAFEKKKWEKIVLKTVFKLKIKLQSF